MNLITISAETTTPIASKEKFSKYLSLWTGVRQVRKEKLNEPQLISRTQWALNHVSISRYKRNSGYAATSRFPSVQRWTMFALGVTPCDCMRDPNKTPISFKRTLEVLTFYSMGHANATQRIVNKYCFVKERMMWTFCFSFVFRRFRIHAIFHENALSALNSIAHRSERLLTVTCWVAETRKD